MEYVAMGILVLLLIGGFVTFLVMQATRRSSPATGDTPGVGTDETPLGDTAQHAGEQTSSGHTVGGTDGDGNVESGEEPADGRFKRDPVGGEAEGSSAIEEDVRRPGV